MVEAHGSDHTFVGVLLGENVSESLRCGCCCCFPRHNSFMEAHPSVGVTNEWVELLPFIFELVVVVVCFPDDGCATAVVAVVDSNALQ
jgi:hypothetical protein